MEKHSLLKRWAICLLFFAIVFGAIISGAIPSHCSHYSQCTKSPSIATAASPDPDFPISLDDGVVLADTFPVGNYFYITDTATITYYHLLWMNPTILGPLLTVYSDAAYSNFMVSTVADYVSWVLIRLSNSMLLYPEVHCTNPGSGYIMWETVNSTLPFGTPVAGALSADHYVEPYRLSLTAGVNYNFTLQLAGTMGDFDLFFYYLDPGEESDGWNAVLRSRTRGWGYDEGFVYQPTVSGEYVVLVALYSGAGPFSLTCTTDQTETEIPMDLAAVLLGLGAALWVWYLLRTLRGLRVRIS